MAQAVSETARFSVKLVVHKAATREAERSISGQWRGRRPSARRGHAARHRFHASPAWIMRNDGSDRRQPSPEPKRVGSAKHNTRVRNSQDAGHCANGVHGLVRAHEPVNPFGLALLSRATQAAAFAKLSRS